VAKQLQSRRERLETIRVAVRPSARPRPEGGVSRADGVFLNRPRGAVVTWDRTSKAVYVEWPGWTDSTEFSALNEAGLRALTEHQGSGWAGRLSQSEGNPADRSRLGSRLVPARSGSGSETHGRGHHEKRLARMNVEDILRRVPGTELDVGYFTTVEEAREWLTGPLNISATGREVKSTS
jgi:hypothetical protein